MKKHYDKSKRLFHYKCPNCLKELYSWDWTPMKCAYCRNIVEPVVTS